MWSNVSVWGVRRQGSLRETGDLDAMTASILDRPTLVLNRNWQPVNVAPVARALTMLWNEAAHVVDPDDYRLYSWSDWARMAPRAGEPFLQAVTMRLRVPEILSLTRFERPRRRGRHLQPPQSLQARPPDLPVLRGEAGKLGVDD